MMPLPLTLLIVSARIELFDKVLLGANEIGVVAINGLFDNGGAVLR